MSCSNVSEKKVSFRYLSIDIDNAFSSSSTTFFFSILHFSYAGRDSAAATATGIKLSHYTEQKNYMEQAMSI